jgi:hypothetical protein
LGHVPLVSGCCREEGVGRQRFWCLAPPLRSMPLLIEGWRLVLRRRRRRGHVTCDPRPPALPRRCASRALKPKP